MKKLLSYLFIMFIGCSVYGQIPAKNVRQKDILYFKDNTLGVPIPIDSFNKYVKPWADSMGIYYGQSTRLIKSKGKSWVIYKGDTLFIDNTLYVVGDSDKVDYSDYGKIIYPKPVISNPDGWETDSRDLRFDTINTPQKVVKKKDKKTGKVYYGWVGVKSEPIDSSKIFWKLYVKNKQRGIPDSLNKYYIKLKK